MRERNETRGHAKKEHATPSRYITISPQMGIDACSHELRCNQGSFESDCT